MSDVSVAGEYQARLPVLLNFTPKEMDINKRVVFRQDLCRTWPDTVMCLRTVRNSPRGFFTSFEGACRSAKFPSSVSMQRAAGKDSCTY